MDKSPIPSDRSPVDFNVAEYEKAIASDLTAL